MVYTVHGKCKRILTNSTIREKPDPLSIFNIWIEGSVF